jgi:DsbC/DsbD-like thiol-disulfide interchange protein
MNRLSALFDLAAAGVLATGLFAAVVAPAPAAAQDHPAILGAEFRPGWRAPDGSHIGALHLSLAPGWKTYWRSPGDAGIPPDFDWAGSENLGAARIEWPRPTVFTSNGLRTIGYDGEVVLPIRFWPRTEGGAMQIDASVDLGLCREVCVPASLTLQAALPPVGQPDPLIDAALRARPQTAPEAAVGRVTCRFEPLEDGLRMTASIAVAPLGPGEIAVIEPPAAVWATETRTRREAGRLIAEADLYDAAGGALALDRSAIRITLLAEGRAVELAGCAAD